MTGPPDFVDEQLWVCVEGIEGKCYLGFNPHTFFGRIGVWCADGGTLMISKTEVREASDAALSWIAGYLIGNEPEPEDLFGASIHDAPEDDARWARWRDAVAIFRETGSWPHEPWRELHEFPNGTRLPEFVWTVRGDEVWTWNGRDWVLADPPPPRRFGLLDGSVCSARGRCDLEMVSTIHSLCFDCGWVTETIPDGVSSEEWERAQYGYLPEPLA